MRKLFAVVAIAAVFTGATLPAVADGVGKNPPQPAPSATVQAPAPAGSPCVDANGAWVNWPYPNVPTLSPPCPVSPASKK